MTRALSRWQVGALLAVVLLVVAFRFAEPIKDGDVFWHLAYAQQILQRGSLTPDATLYSWTPASNATIYVSWLTELALAGLKRWLGWPGLFALRYAAVLAILGLMLQYARRVRAAARLGTPLILLLVVLATAPTVQIKPELLSVVSTHLLLWLWFSSRQADRQGRSPAPHLWAVPVMMMVWVNGHGGFILAAPLMLAILVGETVNRLRARRASPGGGLASSDRHYRILWAAWIAAAAAVLINPHGIQYPRQLVAQYLAGGTARPDIGWNTAYQRAWSPSAAGLHLIELLALMAAMLGWLHLVARRRRRADTARSMTDAVPLALLAASLPLYLWYVRSTYLLPAVFGYVALTALAQATEAPRESHTSATPGRWVRVRRRRVRARRWKAVAGTLLPVAVFAGLAGRALHDTRCAPESQSWAGFGIGYVNPVEEAEYLARRRLGSRLYNIFDSGGYLLWRLYPGHRVMVDSRSFPYLDWFDDQYRFTLGESFEAFLARYPADVAVIDLAKGPVWRNFMRSPRWRPVFLGPTAVVFVPRGTPELDALPFETAAGLGRLRNAGAAMQVFDFAVYLGDYRTAWKVANQLDTALACEGRGPHRDQVRAYREAHGLARSGRYDEARERLRFALHGKVPGDRDQALLVLLEALRVVKDRSSVEFVTIEAGLKKLLPAD